MQFYLKLSKGRGRSEVIRAWYQGIKKRRGSKIARVAVMRRPATIVWHMAKYKETYIVGGTPRHRLNKAAAVPT